jgi:hypothetical protein
VQVTGPFHVWRWDGYDVTKLWKITTNVRYVTSKKSSIPTTWLCSIIQRRQFYTHQYAHIRLQHNSIFEPKSIKERNIGASNYRFSLQYNKDFIDFASCVRFSPHKINALLPYKNVCTLFVITPTTYTFRSDRLIRHALPNLIYRPSTSFFNDLLYPIFKHIIYIVLVLCEPHGIP